MIFMLDLILEYKMQIIFYNIITYQTEKTKFNKGFWLVKNCVNLKHQLKIIYDYFFEVKRTVNKGFKNCNCCHMKLRLKIPLKIQALNILILCQ